MTLDINRNLRQPLEQAILPAAFYALPTLDIARQLLGKLLLVADESTAVSQAENGATSPELPPIALTNLVGGLIVETEGYVGQEDPACHAYRGLTARNRVMWGTPGRSYVYFTYGNHWMLNVVTERSGFPAAVLIRAIAPTISLAQMHTRRNLHLLKAAPAHAADLLLTNGPGKLCQALGIDARLNGEDLRGPRLFICDPAGLSEPTLSQTLPPFETTETVRIGISQGVDLPWRYYVKGNPYVSRPLLPKTPVPR